MIAASAHGLITELHPADRPAALAAIAELRGEEPEAVRQMTARRRLSDGHYEWAIIEWTLVRDPESDQLGFTVTAREATQERADALSALEEGERRFSELIERVPAVVYEAQPDGDGAFYYLSNQIEALLGYPAEDFVAEPELFDRCVHPDDRAAVRELERREADIARAGNVTCVSEYRMVDRQGQTIWVRDEARLTATEGERPYWRGILSDITAERKAERELAGATERYRHLIDSLPVCVYRSDPRAGRPWEFVSPQIEELLGYTEEEWLAEPSLWVESLHPEDRDEVVEKLREHAETADLEAPMVIEYRMLDRTGRELSVRDRAVVTKAPDGRRLLDGMLTDLSSQRPAPNGVPDVFRLSCPSCETVWTASEMEPCPSCGRQRVDCVSLNATLAALAAARKRFEMLLDGTREHLQVLAQRRELGAATQGVRIGGRRTVARVEQGVAPEPRRER